MWEGLGVKNDDFVSSLVNFPTSRQLGFKHVDNFSMVALEA